MVDGLWFPSGKLTLWFMVYGLLEGGLEHDLFYEFPYIGDVIIPTDELIFFRGVETTNQMIYL